VTCAVWSTWGHATGSCERGLLQVPWGKHPRRQILTIEDLLTGKTIDRPPVQTSVTFKKAPKAKGKTATPTRLDFDTDADGAPGTGEG